MTPASSVGSKEKFIVSKGESVRQVAKALQQAGLIRNSAAFMLYYKLHTKKEQVKSGTYQVSPNQTAVAILNEMAHGNTIPDTVTVTIPEGFNVSEIAARLQSSGVCKAQAFIYAVSHASFQQPFLKKLSNRKHIRYRLEGYLFPDTYDFKIGDKPDAVINRMLDDFSRRVLTKQNKAALIKDHLSLNKMVTEASLVENEAKVESERPLIASVIDNRLKAGMKLQIDATVEYALGHHVAVVTTKETKIKSPYNTYMVKGLPPGPIDNPGLKSINAVLHPATTKYLYYVAKGDGSGEHYFSKTYSQQLKNEHRRTQNLKKAAQ